MYWLPAILILPYFFLILTIYRNLLKIVPFKVTSIPSTRVSVIISCRNEVERLPALLQNIRAQDYPTELLELIIVDDHSTDGTFETASALNNPVMFHLLRNKGRGKKEAIRTAIMASHNNLIISTDADCTMGKSWIKTIASFSEKNSPDLIICPVQLSGKGGFYGSFQKLEFLSLQGVTAGSVMAGKAIMCNGANLAFTRETYLQHEGNLHFELASGDDVFLLHSLKKESGSKIMWLESADSVVSTLPSPTIMSYLTQRSRWISKWNKYDDRITIVTGILTFSAVLLQLAAFVALFINISFIWIFLTILILKSIPDFMILLNTTARYGKKELMCWFLPAQLIYPFYVFGVILGRVINSPFQKGI
jgi:cellulose synthase/poly-beta-1,6-N-acetylglucosamine synthase-like glycosyltransferase